MTTAIDVTTAIAFNESKRMFLGSVGTTRTTEVFTGFAAAGSVALALSVRGLDGTATAVIQGSSDGDEWSDLGDFGTIDHAGAYGAMIAAPLDRLRVVITGSITRAVVAVRAYPGGSDEGLSSPLTLGNCVLWLDATQLEDLDDDDPVASWPDLSPANTDATQADTDKQPAFKDDAFGALPGVRFDSTGNDTATDDVLNVVGGMLSALNEKTGFTIAAVISPDPAVSNAQQIIAGAIDLGEGGWVNRFWLRAGASCDAAVGASNDDAEESIEVVNFNESSQAFPNRLAVVAALDVVSGCFTMQSADGRFFGCYLNTDSLTPGPFPDTDMDLIEIGGSNTLTGTSDYKGDIGELIVFDRALTAPERRQLLDYLTTKWGLL